MQAFLQRVERSSGCPPAARPTQRTLFSSVLDPSPDSTPAASLHSTEQDTFLPDPEPPGSAVLASPVCKLEAEGNSSSPEAIGPPKQTGPEATNQAQLTIELQAVKACSSAGCCELCRQYVCIPGSSMPSAALACTLQHAPQLVPHTNDAGLQAALRSARDEHAQDRLKARQEVAQAEIIAKARARQVCQACCRVTGPALPGHGVHLPKPGLLLN